MYTGLSGYNSPTPILRGDDGFGQQPRDMHVSLSPYRESKYVAPPLPEEPLDKYPLLRSQLQAAST